MVPTRQMYPEDERQGVLVVREDGGCPRRETGTIALWPARHLTIGSRGISSCQVPERNDDQLPRGRLGCRGRSGPIGASTKSPGRVGERSASAAVAERQLRFRPIVSRFGGPSGPSTLIPTMAC